MQERILVIKLSALGDFILALGAMEAVRRHHRDAHITLLTTQPFVDMAQRSRWFDEIWVDKRPAAHDLPAWMKLIKKLNSAVFSRVYDLQLNGRTAVYRRLMLKNPPWSGVGKGSPLFYPNPEWRAMHAFTRHREILKVAGLDMELPDISWMKVDVGPLAPPQPYILFIPGSAPQHPRKRWPAVRYGMLALRLSQQGYRVLALGTAAEAGTIASIRRACPEVVDLTDKTSLYDIATLARGAAGAVGNDTGPTHLVALAGCPTVALFSGASHPDLSAPVGATVRTLRAEDLSDIQPGQVLNALPLRAAA